MSKLITITLISLSTSIFAQDQVAKEVLDRLNATSKSYKNMTIDFIVNTVCKVTPNRWRYIQAKWSNFYFCHKHILIVHKN